MNKKSLIKVFLIIIIIVILLIPIKKKTGNVVTYNAIAYKYIIWNEESIYGNNASNEIHIFPLNFKKIEEYRKESIPLAYASYDDEKVELFLGTAVWKKRTYDEIFPIARNHKETLTVPSSATITLDIGTLSLHEIAIYELDTTNQIKTDTTFDDKNIYLKDLPKKEYVISIITTNNNGKVSYSFKINIE